MSDLKIDARLKEINIKIRAMEGEQTRRRLEAANGLNDELHAVDDKFHEDMKSLKENYMQERQSIEDRYFAERKAIDKEYEDKRLDLIDSIKDVIGDISEVVGFEPVKSEEPISSFQSVNNDYTSIFDNANNLVNNDVVDTNPVNQTPLTSLDDIEESLEEVTSGFSPIEPAIEDINMPIVDNFTATMEVPEVNNVSFEQPVIQEPIIQNEVISQNVIVEPAVSAPIQTEPVLTNAVVETPLAPAPQVQALEEVPITPVMPAVEQVMPTEPVMTAPEQIQPVVSEQVIEQPVPATFVAEQNVVQDINASIDNVLGDINAGVN